MEFLSHFIMPFQSVHSKMWAFLLVKLLTTRTWIDLAPWDYQILIFKSKMTFFNQTILGSTMVCKCLILKWLLNTMHTHKILRETERWAQALSSKILMLLMRNFLMCSNDPKTSFKEILKKLASTLKPKFKQQPIIKPSALKQTWEWMTETRLRWAEIIPQ
jgi:hypothetical protein